MEMEPFYRAAGYIGTLLFALASSVEPDLAVWFWAIGASFMAIAFGKDRTISQMLLHWCVGTMIAMAGTSLAFYKFGIPRAPVAIVLGLFGYTIFAMIERSLKEGSIASILTAWRGGGK